jgi:hypothetical protein
MEGGFVFLYRGACSSAASVSEGNWHQCSAYDSQSGLGRTFRRVHIDILSAYAPCGRTGTWCERYHGRLIEVGFDHEDNLVAMFHLGLVLRAKIVSMGGASHIAKKIKKDDEGFKGKQESRRWC